MEFTAEMARAAMKKALDNYNIGTLKEEVFNEIKRTAERGGNKIYHIFSEETPENAKALLVDYLCGIGYDANLPVADKTKVRVSWR